MSAPNFTTAAADSVVQLQTYTPPKGIIENIESKLDKRFSDMGPQTITSLQEFRIGLQYEQGGSFGAGSTDGGNYPAGTGGAYNEGIMTPVEILLAITATDLQRRIMSSGEKVVMVNTVDKLVADSHIKMPKKRNQSLQGYNTGQIATVSATYAGGGANPIALASSPFGSRCIDIQDTVQFMSGDGNYTLRGSAVVVDAYKNSIGTSNQITVDTVPAGVVAGDYVMVNNVAAGSPLFFNGINYIVNGTTTGEYLGMDRSLSYVQSPTYNANSSLITLGIVETFLARMQQSGGTDTFETTKKNFWYGHQAQRASWNQLGFAIQQVTMPTGKAPNFDGTPSHYTMESIGGVEWLLDSVAAIDKLYFMDQGSMVRARFNKAPQFVPGPMEGMWYPRPSGNATSSYKDAWLYDAVNYASRNPWMSGVVFGLAIETSFSN
jgi:hypothetical protein